MNPGKFGIWLFLIVLIGVRYPGIVRAEVISEVPVVADNAYCGINCVYTASSLLGVKINFIDLVDPKYVGSRDGSTLSELKSAAESHGLRIAIFERLSVAILGRSNRLAILHVISGEDRNFNHFVLYAGTVNGQARLLDGPHLRLVSFNELAEMWDGSGMIVSQEQAEADAIFSQARDSYGICAVVLIGIFIVVFYAKRKDAHIVKSRVPVRCFLRRHQGFVQFGTIVAVASVAGIWFNENAADGLLVESNVVGAVKRSRLAAFLPKVDISRVERYVIEKRGRIIDARYERDFEAGHIDGAINCPVDLSIAELQPLVAGVDRGEEIVIYCQSKTCPFSGKVAERLLDLGFSRISIYKGGWNEWKESKYYQSQAAQI